MPRKKAATPPIPTVSPRAAATREGHGWLYEDSGSSPVVAVELTARDIRSLLQSLDELRTLRIYSRERDNRAMATVFEDHLIGALQSYLRGE
ncbi:MAG: hypothetical protein Q8R28_04565 [Dehalococcoidia bacterium]|nr:hypothetical protein [Dehalococcoidia bacterium]